MLYPAAQDLEVSRLQIDKFNAHADARFHDPNHTQRFHLLILPGHRNANASVRGERPARANERSSHGNVGGDALSLCATFEVQQFGIGRKRITNTIPPVANTAASRVAFQCSVVHGNDVTHTRLRRAAKGSCLPRLSTADFSLHHKPRPGSASNRAARQKDNIAGLAQRAAFRQRVITWNDKPLFLSPACPLRRASLIAGPLFIAP